MAERYIHGFYSPEIFCTLIVRASKIPMDDYDKKIIYIDMFEALTGFLADLPIGQGYNVDVIFHTQLSRLHVMAKRHPDLAANEKAVVSTGRLQGYLQRLDEELFMYNQLVANESDKSDTIKP